MLGWDGLGVVSFLLVIYYHNMSSLKSGLVTIYTNRFGDVAMIFSLFLMYDIGYWRMELFFNSLGFNFMRLFLILAAITKRAQLPFSSWLPAAMAAPTPVSSLVHSSTLVTAGVYILIRFYYILVDMFFMKIFNYFSILTSLAAGFIACVEPDLRKVVAISTLRQLGLILYIISLGEILYCYYHIVCHALFKALLFLSCGLIIFLSLGNQDRRFIGTFSLINPILNIMFISSRISLFGVPFLAGFYSKDAIIEISFLLEENFLIFFLLFICCLLTMIYRIRLFLFGVRSFRIGELVFNFYRFLEVHVPMVFLYIWAVSLGKVYSLMIFYSFFSLNFLLDKLIGVYVLVIGFLFFLLKVWNYYSSFIKEFFGDMIFLNWSFGGMVSNNVLPMITLSENDLLWAETFGAKNLYNFLLNVNFILYNKIFLKKKLYIFIFFFFLLVFIF